MAPEPKPDINAMFLFNTAMIHGLVGVLTERGLLQEGDSVALMRHARAWLADGPPDPSAARAARAALAMVDSVLGNN